MLSGPSRRNNPRRHHPNRRLLRPRRRRRRRPLHLRRRRPVPPRRHRPLLRQPVSRAGPAHGRAGHRLPHGHSRRGHDHVANGIRGGPLAGYAFESVDDARADFAAWLELLRERGHRRIAIGGHSGGAVRAAYAQATERFDNVVAVMPVSPGEYNHEGVVALHGEDFAGPFRDSEQNVAEGRPDVADPTGRSLGLDVERPGLRRLLQSGQPLQRHPPRREHRLPHALHLRSRGVRHRRPPGAPRMRRSPPQRGSRRIPARPSPRNRRSRPRLHGPRARALQHNALLAQRALGAGDHRRSFTTGLGARLTGLRPPSHVDQYLRALYSRAEGTGFRG